MTNLQSLNVEQSNKNILLENIFIISFTKNLVLTKSYSNDFPVVSENILGEIFEIVHTQPVFTYSKSTIKTPKRGQRRRSGVFIVSYKQI